MFITITYNIYIYIYILVYISINIKIHKVFGQLLSDYLGSIYIEN